MLHIIIGRARTGKSTLILDQIRRLGDSGRQILLVPEHASYQAELDLCDACGNTVSRHAEVLSVQRLCDRVLGIVGGQAKVSLDAGGRLLTLQKVLMELAPELRVYRHPSQKTAFLRKLLDLFDEFRSYGVVPSALMEQVDGMENGSRDKLHDLGLLYAAYEAQIHSSTLDVRDPVSKLNETLEGSGYVKGKDVFVDGFSYFTAQELRLLQIILREASSLTVVLLGEENSREEIFDASNRMLAQLKRLAADLRCPVEITRTQSDCVTELDHLERYAFGGNRIFEGGCGRLHLREADTVYSEVEQTAADIRRLVAGGQCRYRDITVAARNMGDYEGTIEAVFERYGIPVYLSRRTDILDQPVLSFLNSVLSSVQNGYEYEDMFRWLKTGLAGLTFEECDLLENYVLKWEIHGRMWLSDTDWTENPDGYGLPMNGERQRRLDTVNALRNRLRPPLLQLETGLKTSQTASGKVEALYRFMEDIGLQTALTRQLEDQQAAGRFQEARETAQLWELMGQVLDQTGRILGDQRMDLDLFLQLFRQVMTEYSVGTVPVTLDQVSVSEITRNDRHTARYLFLLGANDHVLPDPGQDNGLLSDDDRDALAESGIRLSPFGMERMSLELQSLYAALAQATEGLTVSYPVTDVSGAELRPAFLAERMTALFPALRVEKEGEHKAYRLTAPLPALEAAGEVPGGTLWQWFRDREETYGPRLAAMERAREIKRGRLSRQAVSALYGDQISMSASRLERLRSCHFAYFMEYGLKARPRAAAFDAPQIGTFLHFLLEHVTRDVLALGGFSSVDDAALHALVSRYIDEYADRELKGLQGKNERFKYLFRRLRNTAYAVVDQVAEELRHSDFVPLEFELSFGDHGAVPGVVISEPDAELRVGGKVDRVDGWVKDGKLYLRVVDYKSGRKAFDLSAVKLGLDIQMLLYLFTLQKNGAAYFGQEIEPAGVLYLPARDELLSAERNIPPDRLAAERQKTLKRSGLLLAEPAVLQAMEHEALTEPHYLPLRVNRSGDLSGSIASAAQLGKLGRYVDKLLRQISHEIRQGNIDADPCCHSEEDSFCQFCDWADACHFQDGRDGDRLHYIQPVKPDEFWAMLAEEEEAEWRS